MAADVSFIASNIWFLAFSFAAVNKDAATHNPLELLAADTMLLLLLPLLLSTAC